MIRDVFGDLHKLIFFFVRLLDKIYKGRLSFGDHIIVWIHGGVCIVMQVYLKRSLKGNLHNRLSDWVSISVLLSKLHKDILLVVRL